MIDAVYVPSVFADSSIVGAQHGGDVGVRRLLKHQRRYRADTARADEEDVRHRGLRLDYARRLTVTVDVDGGCSYFRALVLLSRFLLHRGIL